MNLEILNMEVVRALYIVSAVLFILTLGGLSNQEKTFTSSSYILTGTPSILDHFWFVSTAVLLILSQNSDR